jgi:Putative beta-barrel porin 2
VTVTLARLRVAALLAAIAALPAAARAQEDSSAIDTVRGARHVHAGPFYFTPALVLKELGVDSNVFNDPERPLTDFTATLTPRTTLWVPIAHRALVTTDVAADLVYYAKYASERSVNPQGTVGVESYLGRITVFANGDYSNSRQRNTYEIDARVRHVDEAVGAGVRVRLTTRLSVDLAATASRMTYQDGATYNGQDLARALNHDTEGGTLTVRDRLTPLTSIAVKVTAARDRFRASPFKDADSLIVMPGVEFKPRALITGSAFVGVRRLTPKSSALPAYTGPVARLGLSYTLLGETSFGATWIRDLAYSYDVRQPYYVDNSVGASIRQAFGPHFDVLVSSDRHLYDYRQLDLAAAGLLDVPLPPAFEAPRTETWTHAASLGYRVGRIGRIGAGVAYWIRRSSSPAVHNYDNLRLQVMVTP